MGLLGYRIKNLPAVKGIGSMGATPEHKLAYIAVLGSELVRSQSLVLNRPALFQIEKG
jgi:hypothetical protein